MGQTVQNGSVTGSPAANSGIVSGYAPPWTRCNFSPDLCDPSRPSYLTTSQVTPSFSPDGGTWLGVAALGECASTDITGLTVGQSYTLYFCGANFGTGALYNGTLAQPRITIGSSIATFAIPQVASTWVPCSMNFTATASIMTLQVDHPNGSNAYASLDGFNLTGTQCSPVVLPAGLENLRAVSRDCEVQLSWSVPEAYAADGFVVEKSPDGEQFELLEEMGATATVEYRATDRFPDAEGYYRLRIQHADGHVAFSNVVQVSRECRGTAVEVTPNPVGTDQPATVHFFADAEAVEISVVGLEGRVVYQRVLKANPGTWAQHSLPTDQWPAGLYMVRTSLGTSNRLVIAR